MPVELHPTYIVDEQGERVAVQLPIDDYRQLLDELEELEATIAFDAAVASGEEPIPFEQVLAGIEETSLEVQRR